MGGGELRAELPDGAPARERSSASDVHPSPARLAAAGLTFAAVAVVLWGGYGHRWPWTGINGNTATLWDWLHLLLLPVAFGLLPVLLSRGTRMRTGHMWAGSLALVCFAAFVAAGYMVPWGWTGFSGNKVWDWLELLALPLAITIVPVMDELRLNWKPRDSLVAAVALAVFVAIVIGGYVGNWSWTGFRGNTLWDWLHLLLLPLLLPTVIVPRLAPRMKATLIVVEEEEPAPTPSEAVPIDDRRSRPDALSVKEKPAQAGPAQSQSSEQSQSSAQARPTQRESLDHVE